MASSITPYPMTNLPIPSEGEVAKFKKLYVKHRGIELSDAEALDLSTRYLQLFYLGITQPPGSMQASDTNDRPSR